MMLVSDWARWGPCSTGWRVNLENAALEIAPLAVVMTDMSSISKWKL